MAGRIVPIIGPTTFTSNLQASQSSIIPIGPRSFSTMDIVSGALSVRFFAASFQTGASLDIGLWNASVTPDFPQTTLYDADATFTITNALAGHNYTTVGAAPLPRIFTHGFIAGANAQCAVVMKFIQSTTAGANSVTIAVDFIGRDS